MSRRSTDGQSLPDELTHDVEDLRDELGKALQDVRIQLAAMARYQSPTATSSASNNNTNHFGGLGLVIAIIVSTACCTAMLTGGAVFAFMTSNQVSAQNAKIAALEATIDRRAAETDAKLASMQDYLSVIYQYAPQLKPKEKSK